MARDQVSPDSQEEALLCLVGSSHEDDYSLFFIGYRNVLGCVDFLTILMTGRQQRATRLIRN
jgi:hypothetical protein